MTLEVGNLVARISIEGLREFVRDQERAGETFRSLGREADRSQDQIARSYQSSTRDAQQYGTRMRDVRRGEERSAQQAASSVRRSQGQMSTAFEQTVRDARSSAQQAGSAFERQFDGAVGQAREAGGSGGSGFIAGFGSKVSMLGSKAGPIGAALAGVGAIGLVAGGVLISAIRDGMDQQQSLANVQANLAVDDATMARLGKAAGAAYAANFGESRDANLTAATAGFDFGLLDVKSTSDEMQNLIEKSATLNQMLGTETPETLRAVSGLVRSGLVANVDQAFDVIAAARTKGLNAQGDLVDSISEYSAGWKNSGLSAQTTMALIKQSMDLGVDNTDRGADAIREFGRRVTEEGPTIVAAINDIGLNGEQMYAAFKKGGPDAEKAFDATFDKIRGIEDPVKRNAAAMALLGDTSGDFIGAFAQWDPSKAVNDFGQVQGAASKASDTIGGTALSAVESAKRGIVQSANDIKLALADAFGPQIQGAVTWLTEHKGEVTGFFADAGAAGMTFLIDTGHVASAALRIWATFGGTIATVIGGFVENLGAATGVIGNLISKIPGMQGVGEGIKSAGDMAKALGAGLQNSADGARSAADFIDGKLIPGLEGAKRGFKEMGDNARGSADNVEHAKNVADTLNTSINALPDNKPVNVTTPGGENAIGLLRDMGVKVRTDNNKNVVVESPLAPNVLDVLRQLNLKVITDNNKTILVTDNGTAKATGDLIDQFVNKKRTAFVDIFPQLVQGTLPKTTDVGSGTATMPLDLLSGGAKKTERASGGRVGGNGGPRADDQLIWASSPEWIIQTSAVEKYGSAKMAAVNAGTANIEAYATGGQVGQLKDYMRGIERQPYAWGGWGNGWATDCSGGQSIAMNYFTGMSTTPGQGERAGTASFDSYTRGHGLKPGRAPAGVPAYEVGWSPEHTAGTIFDPAGGDVNIEMGGDRGDGQYDGPTGSRSGQFSSSAWAPLGGDPGTAGNMGSGSVPGSSSTTGSVSGGSGAAGGSGSPVFVTNWPAALADEVSAIGKTGKGAKSTTAGPVGLGPLPIAAYAEGGFGGQPKDATMLRSARSWITLAGEAGDEAFIPMNGSDRSRGLWVEAGKRLGMTKAYAHGGFGGYSDDTRDYMAPTSLSDYVALGVGGAATVASVAAPYIGMATGKQVDLGNLTPNVDTGANSVDGVAQAVGQTLDAVQKQLAEIAEAVKKDGKHVYATVTNMPRPPIGETVGMRMTAAGM